jgi:hypothetical protein
MPPAKLGLQAHTLMPDLFVEARSLTNFLPRLTSNITPSNPHLQNIWNCRNVSLHYAQNVYNFDEALFIYFLVIVLLVLHLRYTG